MAAVTKPKRAGNLGTTQQKLRSRSTDPMLAYDRLPPELRAWMAGAALPWSPKSCLGIWRRALREGASLEQALQRLNRAEQSALRRERPPARVA